MVYISNRNKQRGCDPYMVHWKQAKYMHCSTSSQISTWQWSYCRLLPYFTVLCIYTTIIQLLISENDHVK
jgi:hypothetical protein